MKNKVFLLLLTLLLVAGCTLAVDHWQQQPGDLSNLNSSGLKKSLSLPGTVITATTKNHKDSAGNAFIRYTLLNGADASQGYSPSFALVKDINGDGYDDILVSQFGPFQGSANPGQITLLYGRGDLKKWNRVVVLPTSENFIFPQTLALEDIDNDGDLDIFVPGGFLVQKNSGALWWYEQINPGTWKKHVIVNGTKEFYHKVLFIDLDKDGIKDLVTVAETAKTMFGGQDAAFIQFFKGNQSADRFNKTPLQLAEGGGSLPIFQDVDGDGLKDIVSAQFFVKNSAGKTESFAWFKNPGNMNQTWQKYVIDQTTGPGFQIEYVKNLFGDQQGHYIGVNHTNTKKNYNDPESGVFLFEVPSNPTSIWNPVLISTGIVCRYGSIFAKQMAPGVTKFGDINGDGRLDLAVSGDGDSRVFWLKQNSDRSFTTITLAGKKGEGDGLFPSPAEFAQCGGMNVVDLDKDQKKEVVVNSWEGNTVNLFEWNQ